MKSCDNVKNAVKGSYGMPFRQPFVMTKTTSKIQQATTQYQKKNQTHFLTILNIIVLIAVA